MEKNEYSKYRTELKPNVNSSVELFSDRLQSLMNGESAHDGLIIIDKIRHYCQNWLVNHGCLGVWLVPFDNYINEYSSNNYIAFNTYYKKHFALIQSPQIQKEAAAIALGDNFRFVDCFRAEKTDFSHCSIFQQLDVELIGRDENGTRNYAESMIEDCINRVKGRTLKCLGGFRQSDLLKWYGTDEPNLNSGCYISDDRTIVLPSLEASALCDIEHFVQSNPTTMHMDANCIRIEQESMSQIRTIWNKITEMIPVNPQMIYAYWLINLPLAQRDSEGKIRATHHIMSKPLLDSGLSSTSLFQFSDDELCRLPSRSYDLMLCSTDHVVEVIGGDMRINSFCEQLDAIKRFGLDPSNYAFLLETLHLNDKNHRLQISGFAVGIERLTQFILNEFDMSFVQLFPTNLPDGKMMHAMSIEEAGIKDIGIPLL